MGLSDAIEISYGVDGGGVAGWRVFVRDAGRYAAKTW